MKKGTYDLERLKGRLTKAERDLSVARDKISNLSSLIETSNIVNSSLDLPTLLDLIMKIAKKVMKAEASSLMLIDEATKELVYEVALGEKGKKVKEGFRLKLGQGIAGWVAKYKRPLLVKDVRSDRRFFPTVDKATGFKTRSILCVPMKVRGETIGILEAINPIKGRSFGREDVELFSAFANQAAIAIENARMHQRLLERQRIEQELAIARQIQQSFLPGVCPRPKGARFFARNISPREVGGDFYDFIELGKGRIGVVVGDVSGKGIPAALYMVKTISEFRNFALLYENADDTLFAINNSLVKKGKFGMFVTLFYLILDLEAKSIRFSNAGHPPLIFREGESDKFRSLEGAGGSPLGIISNMSYTQEELSLKKGDLLLSYTDGVVEARDSKGKEFTLERLKALVRGKRLEPRRVIDEILREVNAFSKGVAQHDDLTLLAISIGT